MGTLREVKVAAILLALSVGIACSGERTVASEFGLVQHPYLQMFSPNVGVLVEAATYGPDGQLVTPPSCTKTNTFKDSSRTRTFSDLNSNGVQDDSIWVKWKEGYSPGQCGLSYDPGGALYDGGIVFSGAYESGVGYAGQQAMAATFDRDRFIELRSPQQLYLEVSVYAGYTFHYWDVTPQTGAAYHDPNPLLFINAGAVGQRYVAVFQKVAPPGGSGGGGGNPCIICDP